MSVTHPDICSTSRSAGRAGIAAAAPMYLEGVIVAMIPWCYGLPCTAVADEAVRLDMLLAIPVYMVLVGI
jgi:hypothetical protein